MIRLLKRVILVHYICLTRDTNMATAVQGVILDSDQIPEGISRKFIRYPGEVQDRFYLRVTHGHFRSQKICQIGDLSPIRVINVYHKNQLVISILF